MTSVEAAMAHITIFFKPAMFLSCENYPESYEAFEDRKQIL